MLRVFFILAWALSVTALPLAGQCAPLAEEHTILYYLVEMQRKTGPGCPGQPKTALPGLIPSEHLRNLAREVASSNASLQTALQRNGYPDAKAIFAPVEGNSPQAAAAAFTTGHCLSAMSPDFSYIGAYKQGTTWNIVMASVNPVPQGTVTVESSALPPPPPPSSQGVTPLYETPATPQSPDLTAGESAAVDQLASGAPAGQEGQQGQHKADSPEGTAERIAGALARPSDQQQTNASASGATSGAASGQAARNAPAVPDPLFSMPGPDTFADKQEAMLHYINQVRAQGYMCGTERMQAGPLRTNDRLQAAADKHMLDMVKNGYFAGTSPDGTNVGKRLSLAGYDWVMLAESLSSGIADPRDVLAYWLSKPNHCKNIMNPHFVDAGISLDQSKEYWLLTLAAPMLP